MLEASSKTGAKEDYGRRWAGMDGRADGQAGRRIGRNVDGGGEGSSSSATTATAAMKLHTLSIATRTHTSLPYTPLTASR